MPASYSYFLFFIIPLALELILDKVLKITFLVSCQLESS
jgi:hypothetical protein